MSISRAARISAKIAAVSCAVFIAIAAPMLGTTMSVADGGSGQIPPPPPPSPDGNPWDG